VLEKLKQRIPGTLRRKWQFTAIIGVGIILAVALGWYFLGKKDTVQVQAATTAVRRGNIEVTVSGTGSVKPSVTRNLTSSSGGTITKINFRTGQEVRTGDLLFELDNEKLRTELKKAELELQQAELDYKTKADESRQQNVTAPISGQIDIIEIEEGQDVQKNATLMVINDTSKLIAEIQFNGGQVNNIKPGQKADVAITSLMTIVEGKVHKVDRGGTAGIDGTKMYDVTVEISNPGALAPGMAVQASIHTPSGIESGYENGTLEWVNTEILRAGVAGTLERLYADEKAYVQKGQKVAYISSNDMSTQLLSLELRVQQARLNLETSQKELADCTIYAPVDGTVSVGNKQTGGGNSGNTNSTTISDEYWQVGDEVSGGHLLATVVSGGKMSVTVPVDEVDIAKVEFGQKAVVTVDALPDRTFTGEVSGIADQGTTSNGVSSFDVTISIDRPERLKENMTANVEIMVAQKNGVLLVPIEAVQERQGRKFVILASGQPTVNGGESDSGDNRAPANMVAVETGLYNETSIEITSGLKEGDVITLVNTVISGNSQDRPNMGMPGVSGGGVRIMNPGGSSGNRDFSGGSRNFSGGNR